MNLTEIASATGFRVSTVHRLLAILRSEQLITEDSGGKRFRLGNRPLKWARVAWNNADLPALAADQMEWLSEVTDQHVSLAIPDGASALFVKTVDRHDRPYLAPALGARSNLHSSSVGKTILAFSPPRRRKKLLDSIELERFTETTITDIGDLERELAETRERGFAINRCEEIPEIHGIAAPIYDFQGDVVAAISIWSLASRTDLEVLIGHGDRLIEAGDEVSRRLGFVKGEEALASAT